LAAFKSSREAITAVLDLNWLAAMESAVYDFIAPAETTSGRQGNVDKNGIRQRRIQEGMTGGARPGKST
jgi:hypothetical protein